MSAGNMIVAFPDQAKGHLAEIWDLSNNPRLEVPPLGFQHTVDTVDELGQALFDDWRGNEMSVYLAPKVYPVTASEVEIEDGRLAVHLHQKLQSKLHAIAKSCALHGVSTPSDDIFDQQFLNFALEQQEDLILKNSEAITKINTVAREIHERCASGELASAYRGVDGVVHEINPSDWNVADPFQRLKKCAVNSQALRDTRASVDATLFFADIPLTQAASSDEDAASSRQFEQILGINYVNRRLAAVLEVAVRLNATEESALAKNDVVRLLRAAARKYQARFSDNQLEIAQAFIRPEHSEKGVKKPEKLNVIAIERQISPPTKR